MKIIKTALPLPAPIMVEFFKNKTGIKFVVDYEQSITNLRTPQALLNYIANLRLVCELEVEKMPPELLATYITMRDVVEVEQLTRIHGNLLYFCKYGESLYEDTLDLFSYEDMVRFVDDNADKISTQLMMLDSLPLFVETARGITEDDIRSEHPAVTTIDDNYYPELSVNLFQLFTCGAFLIQFLENSIELSSQVYFKQHYEENMYGGMTMFAKFGVPDNPYFTLCQNVGLVVESGLQRYKLASMYIDVASELNDSDVAEYEKEIENAGGLNVLLNLSRKDQAEIKRSIRRDKKACKKTTQ